MYPNTPLLTEQVSLDGGQRRLREAILYIADACAACRWFGAIKLNKILWKADFDSFAARRVPVTGRPYVRQKFGPVPKEMLTAREGMQKDGEIRMERRPISDGKEEHRLIALRRPDRTLFSREDMRWLDISILYYFDKTGTEASDDSHGVAWSTRGNGDTMPYEAAFISDAVLSGRQKSRISEMMMLRGWVSD